MASGVLEADGQAFTKRLERLLDLAFEALEKSPSSKPKPSYRVKFSEWPAHAVNSCWTLDGKGAPDTAFNSARTSAPAYSAM